MKYKLTIILVLIIKTSFGQIPVTDVAANANLVILNTQISTMLATLGTIEGTIASVEGTMASVEGTGVENSATNGEALTESAAQGETMIEQLDQVEEIQKELEKVKKAIKDVKQVKNSLIYIVKIIRDTNYILGKINNLEYEGHKIFNSNQISNINDEFDKILGIVNDLMEVIQKLVKDDIFKMDDGNRLKLLLDISEKIKNEYEKVHKKRMYLEKSFEKLIGKPIQG
jgi:hypothetical protein